MEEGLIRKHPTTHDMLQLLRPRLTRYIPHKPTPKQRAFLCLPHKEAFYGGAAGGGKSDALLMAALQYVDIPGYSAMIVRKTLADAKMPSSILFRSRQWLAHTDAIWKSSEHTWYFPSGATLKFGMLGKAGDAVSYQSSEYHYLGFDEQTQFTKYDFEYLTTRLRRNRCPYHMKTPNPACQTCMEYALLSRVPLRVRGASNPGGLGHMWNKHRYLIDKLPDVFGPSGKPIYVGQHPDRPHIPAFVWDNPFIDQEDYMQQLAGIEDPVTREQLLSGDWGISADGRFKADWVQRYTVDLAKKHIELTNKTWHEDELNTFLIIDPAASRDATPGKTDLIKKNNSWTAAGVFSATPDSHLIVRKIARHQQEVPETKHLIVSLLREFPQIRFVGMETSPVSMHLYQLLSAEGFNMKAFTTGGRDKIARSVEATNRMEKGQVWFPLVDSPWLRDFEEEVFTWTGDRNQTDDQVDVLCYAGLHISQNAAFGSLPVIF